MAHELSRAAGRAERNVDAGEREKQIADVACWRRGFATERTARIVEEGADVGWSEQAVVTDLDEAGWQDVLDEAIEEVDRIERDGLSVLGSKGNAARVEGDEPLVGDSDAMGVAAEVAHDVLGSAEGSLGVDDEELSMKRDAESIEGFGIFALRAKIASAMGGAETRDQLGSKEGSEDGQGKEVARACPHPTAVGRGPTAACDDAVDVRVKAQIARPGVKDARDAEQSAEPLWIETERDERFAGRGEHGVEDDATIELREGAKLGRQSEDDVEVAGWEQTGAARADPARLRERLTFRAMTIATRVVARALVTAARADVEVSAELGGPAALDVAERCVLIGLEAIVRNRGETIAARALGYSTS